MSGADYNQPVDICGCKCTDGPIGTGGCCLLVFCPCISHQTAATQIGQNGCIHCLMGCCGCACCSTMMLGEAVEKKRNIEQHDCVWHGLYSFFSLCTCQDCRVINECAVYAKEGALKEAPSAVVMGDRGGESEKKA